MRIANKIFRECELLVNEDILSSGILGPYIAFPVLFAMRVLMPFSQDIVRCSQST